MPKKRVIIREDDILKFKRKYFKQYQRIEFTPFTKSFFERRVTYFALKGKSYLADQFAHYEYPNNMLGRFTSFKLFDRRYPNWLVKYNEQGEMVIRAGLRQPESRVGYLTLVEKSA
jgi:hypothetical protein